MKWAISESKANNSGLCYRVHQNTAWSERAFTISDLTSLYIYFPTLFCQNTVKKICKFLVIVFVKNADIKSGESTESVCLFCWEDLLVTAIWIYHYVRLMSSQSMPPYAIRRRSDLIWIFMYIVKSKWNAKNHSKNSIFALWKFSCRHQKWNFCVNFNGI